VFGKRSSSPDSPATAVAEPPHPAPHQAPPPSSPVAPPQGGRAPFPSAGLGAPILGAPKPAKGSTGPASPPQQVPTAVDLRRSDKYYETKGAVFGALIEAIDLGQLAKLDADSAREEIRDIVNEIIAIKNIVMSIAE
jgi:pilus assembly protein CpaF